MQIPTIEEIESGKYRLDHTSKASGYISRKIKGKVLKYNGRFGSGWIIDRPSFDSTRFFYREYWTENPEVSA